MYSKKIICSLLLYCVVKISKSEKVNRTFAGKRVGIEHVPYTVVINTSITRCTGALISNECVITAKHCFGHASYRKSLVGLGSNHLPGFKYWIGIEKVHYHPSANRTSRIPMSKLKKNIAQDIALLKLRKPATFSRSVRPLQLAEDKWPANLSSRECTVAGFGVNKYYSSFLLQSVFIIRYGPKSCLCMTYPGILCGRSIQADDSICKGDSGAALVCDNKAVGIVSSTILNSACSHKMVEHYNLSNFEKFCGRNDTLDLFTYIYPHLSWIKEMCPSMEPSLAPTLPAAKNSGYKVEKIWNNVRRSYYIFTNLHRLFILFLAILSVFFSQIAN